MQKGSVKDRLIDTATELFYEQGYNRTGINEILMKSGVAKASMYQHFRSKEEICLEFLRKMDREHKVAFKEKLNEYPVGKERILGIFDYVQSFYERENYRGCWCINTLAEISDGNQILMEEIRGQKILARKFFKNLIAENLPESDADSLGDSLYLLYDSALSESLLFGKDWPIHQAKETIKKLI